MDEHKEILYRGRVAWNKWRWEHRELPLRPDLTGLSLSRFSDDSDLADYDLSGARLRGAVLSKISLERANLTDADCREAQFSAMSLEYCNLTSADLRNAKLFNCYLRHANLTGTNFAGAALKNVHFDGVTLNQTIFGNDDLSGALHLDQAIHRGAVIIGARALEESRGRIPPTFLQKAEVPTEIVKIALKWAKQPVAYLSCFISHSSEDKDFVAQIRDRLTNSGVDTFLSSKDLKPGQRYPDEIKRQLLSAGRVIVVMSRSALRSDWVEREVQMTIERERREGQFLIIPLVRIAADEWSQTKVAWARNIHEYVHAVSFHRRTTGDLFEVPYQRLLNGLRIAASANAPR